MKIHQAERVNHSGSSVWGGGCRSMDGRLYAWLTAWDLIAAHRSWSCLHRDLASSVHTHTDAATSTILCIKYAMSTLTYWYSNIHYTLYQVCHVYTHILMQQHPLYSVSSMPCLHSHTDTATSTILCIKYAMSTLTYWCSNIHYTLYQVWHVYSSNTESSVSLQWLYLCSFISIYNLYL